MRDWDEEYRSVDIAAATPARVLLDYQYLLPNGGSALDYACGAGINSIWLAQQNWQVTAVDASSVVVDKINLFAEQQQLPIQAIQQDLESQPLLPSRFDLILVSHFLYRPALPQLADMLNPGGLLFYQTFSGRQIDGRGPSRPEFRLRLNELLQVYNFMQIVAYREDQELGDPNLAVQGETLLVARKPD